MIGTDTLADLGGVPGVTGQTYPTPKCTLGTERKPRQTYLLGNCKNYHNTKIPIIHVFFLLDLTKPIKVNKFKVYTTRESVDSGMTDVKNSCIFLSCLNAYFRNNSKTYG